MTEDVGMTSKEFIKRMEKAGIKPLDIGEILGISKEQFIKLAREIPTISGTVEEFKAKGITEFGSGFGARMVIDLSEKAEERMEEMLSTIAGRKREREAEILETLA